MGHAVPDPGAAAPARPARVHRRTHALMVLAALAYVGVGPVRAAEESAAPQRALLELVVNGMSQGDALVIVRGAEIWVEVARLREAGLHTLDGRLETTDGRELIELSTIRPAVRVELDEIGLRLAITARPASLGHIVINGMGTRPDGVVTRRARAGFLDYGLTWSAGGQSNVALEGGASVGPWLLGTSMSSVTGFGTVRGTTSLTLDQAERMNRWIVGETQRTAKAVTEALADCGYDAAAGTLYRFIWNVFCDWYVELAKPLLNGEDAAAKAETQATAAWALDVILKLLHPVMPFITEELWSWLPAAPGFVMTSPYPVSSAPAPFAQAQADFAKGAGAELTG